ncbi:hypothetical protein GGI04_001355 [Coemansia thaxteri]|uniref:Uncharacterized protein n=1 Tax=Coemansia thaxteri TaxID=2663907 RepID=A0A9W8EEF1_9FUNG|nr:hypothetical protein H4R26_004008 [Coemansia thaxteri]KAJ2007875.1 hypothetical protein GGI04_001355 [Coemansia thaxteri]KAJ2470586.1 hypothetical protein GGI02_002829 [Coemansia sp. RSA 2322]KAJ2483140.1 hypothetical protein EV174_003025 [Coemansia sp. RSA 2320]
MFSSGNIHNTISQNKENAALSSVTRNGKAGLLGGKVGGGLQPGRMASKVFGSPAHLGTRTPGGKALAGKQQTTLRTGLRDITLTPSNRQVTLERAPKTIKRVHELFSPRTQVKSTTLQALEPEYAPPRSVSPAFDAMGAFGCDLDISMVPATQYSTSGARLRELPPVDLVLEVLVDINIDQLSFSTSSLKIPRPKELSPALLACRPRPLVACALYPTRIPQLKRKR